MLGTSLYTDACGKIRRKHGCFCFTYTNTNRRCCPHKAGNLTQSFSGYRGVFSHSFPIFRALSSKSLCRSFKKSERARWCCQRSARPYTHAGVNVSAESAKCCSLCAGSGPVAVQQNGTGAPGGRLEGQPRACHVLLQEGALQL